MTMRTHAAILLGLALCASSAGAAEEKEKDEAAKVQINALKNPELKNYRAIVAGLDKFDQLHALAPAVPQLRFQVEGRNGKALGSELPVARIAADDFLDSADARPGCALFGAAQPGRLRRQGRADPEPQEA
jgi:hypothetical protein